MLAGLGELWESMTPLEQLVLTDRMLASRSSQPSRDRLKGKGYPAKGYDRYRDH